MSDHRLLFLQQALAAAKNAQHIFPEYTACEAAADHRRGRLCHTSIEFPPNIRPTETAGYSLLLFPKGTAFALKGDLGLKAQAKGRTRVGTKAGLLSLPNRLRAPELMIAQAPQPRRGENVGRTSKRNRHKGEKLMKSIGKYLPSIISILALVAGTFAQPVQEAIAAHPNVALALGGVYSILSHLLPSPLKK